MRIIQLINKLLSFWNRCGPIKTEIFISNPRNERQEEVRNNICRRANQSQSTADSRILRKLGSWKKMNSLRREIENSFAHSDDGQHKLVDLLCLRGPWSVSQTLYVLGGLDDIGIPFSSHCGPLLMLRREYEILEDSLCMWRQRVTVKAGVTVRVRIFNKQLNVILGSWSMRRE